MSGSDGSRNIPTAATSTSASTSSPDDVAIRQVAEPGSHAAPVTVTPNRQWDSTPWDSARPRRYVQDLGLGPVGLRPVRLGSPREGVERRLDVALAAGVPVDQPGAPDALVALEDHHVVEARIQQILGDADPSGPRSDHGDPHPAVVRTGTRPPPARQPLVRPPHPVTPGSGARDATGGVQQPSSAPSTARPTRKPALSEQSRVGPAVRPGRPPRRTRGTPRRHWPPCGRGRRRAGR